MTLKFLQELNTYTAAFVVNEPCYVQINRESDGVLWVEVSDNEDSTAVKIPFTIKSKEAFIPVDLPAGMVVKIVSAVPVVFGAVIGSAGRANIPDVDPSQTYYPNAFRDYDGNWYDAVIIGNQVWMAENLRLKHYDDGTEIRRVTGSLSNYGIPFYVVRNNELYYNLVAVKHGETMASGSSVGIKGIAPEGWHVPNSAEFQTLINYTAQTYRNVSIAKSLSAKSGWPSSPNSWWHPGYEPQTNNSTGFSAICTYHWQNGSFYTNLVMAMFYSCESMLYFPTSSGFNNAEVWSSGHNGFAACVRCVCDKTPEQFAQWYVEEYGTLNHQVDNKYGN